MSDASVNTRQYFAQLKPNELIGEALKRVEDFDQHLKASGRWDLWALCYAFYNQAIYADGQITREGEQGEYSKITVNHFRNLLTHMLTMTTNQRPSYDSRATNTDYDSQAQTIVANGILEFYDRFKGMGDVAKQATEDYLVFGDGYVYQGWDFSLGQPLAPDLAKPGTIQKEGDVLLKNFMPMDVIFDFKGGLRNAGRQWYILRDFQNKWDLIARYPEMKEQILRYADDDTNARYVGSRFFRTDSDYIPVFIFIHDRTDSVPNGRYFTFLGKECWFVDSALPAFYKNSLPVKRLCGGEQRGSGFGYSIAFDLAPLQEAVNGLYSTILTNQSTFGVQLILMPTGANIGAEEISNGLTVINFDPKQGEPKALNLTSTPQEIFAFLQQLEGTLETISGVNSVARGNPEESLKSGTALALVQSMAIQFMSGLQQSYASLLEALGTGLIEILQGCANSPRIVEIAGKNNKAYVQKFTNKDIASISRVTVDLGNPIARTLAGKVNMAETLLNAGMIENAQQYIQVLTTGKLEPLIEGKQAELMLIRAENEALGDGQPVQATAIDSHHLHVMEHRCVIASPAARENPAIVNVVVAHIQQHIDLWKELDPSLAQMIGEPVPPPPAVPALPGPAGPGSLAPSPTGTPTASGELVNANPVNAQAAKVRPPQQPKNPLSNNTAIINGGIH